MTHNLVYDHKGKMIANENGLIALPPARHWMELLKEKNDVRDIMSVVQEGESVTFKASYPRYSETVSITSLPSAAARVYFGILSEYTLVSDPDHGLEIRATIKHSPEGYDSPDRIGAAFGSFDIFIVSAAGRSIYNTSSHFSGRIRVPVTPSYDIEYYRLLTPETRGLDYRSHVHTNISGGVTSSYKTVLNADGSTYSNVYTRAPMSYTLTIKKVKL